MHSGWFRAECGFSLRWTYMAFSVLVPSSLSWILLQDVQGLPCFHHVAPSRSSFPPPLQLTDPHVLEMAGCPSVDCLVKVLHFLSNSKARVSSGHGSGSDACHFRATSSLHSPVMWVWLVTLGMAATRWKQPRSRTAVQRRAAAAAQTFTREKQTLLFKPTVILGSPK